MNPRSKPGSKFALGLLQLELPDINLRHMQLQLSGSGAMRLSAAETGKLLVNSVGDASFMTAGRTGVAIITWRSSQSAVFSTAEQVRCASPCTANALSMLSMLTSLPCT